VRGARGDTRGGRPLRTPNSAGIWGQNFWPSIIGPPTGLGRVGVGVRLVDWGAKTPALFAGIGAAVGAKGVGEQAPSHVGEKVRIRLRLAV